MYHMQYSRVLQLTQLSTRPVSIWKFDTERRPSRPTAFYSLMVLCALISGLITLWIIVCTFCSLLSWQSAQKNLYIYPATTPVPSIYLLKSTGTCVLASRHQRYYCISIAMYLSTYEWNACGTIFIRCSLAVRGNGFQEPTNFYMGPVSMILWFVSDALNFQPLWPNGYMVGWYRSPVAKGKTFLPSWIIRLWLPFHWPVTLPSWQCALVDWLRLASWIICNIAVGADMHKPRFFLKISGCQIWTFVLEFNV